MIKINYVSSFIKINQIIKLIMNFIEINFENQNESTWGSIAGDVNGALLWENTELQFGTMTNCWCRNLTTQED